MERTVGPRWKWLVTAVAVAAAVGGTAAFVGGDDRDQAGAVGAGPVLDGPPISADASGVDQPSLTGEVEAPAPARPTPEDAVESFFAAETADDFTGSFGLLSAADRKGLGNSKEWAAAHDELPAYLSFTASGPATIDGGEAIVAGSLQMQPVVDEAVGVIPARAEAKVVAVAEDGGWRIAFAESIFVPVFPDDAGAAPAALDWIARRQVCQTSRDGYTGNLLGDPRLETALCGTSDRYAVEGTTRIDDAPDVTPFLSTFGPDGIAALRAVSFSAPTAPLTVVVAPLGDTWVVVGAE